MVAIAGESEELQQLATVGVDIDTVRSQLDDYKVHIGREEHWEGEHFLFFFFPPLFCLREEHWMGRRVKHWMGRRVKHCEGRALGG